ncbi:hypothetical protein AB0I30_03075 [Nocardia tengchongensis]|uniref:hypothetical protein n=1 Tax=Nocardia tengchongensis TaxID=2055889 RepID=UPI0033C31A0C
MSEVFMSVSSSNSFRDDEVRVRYQDSIDKVVVDVGSGGLYMSLSVAEELFEKLREALQYGALTQAVTSGSGVWLSATEFVPAEDVSDLREKAVA